MPYSCRIFRKRLTSQDGFALLAAIMAVMIMIAVGFFALTVTSQDIRISSRLIGERKAFSAAEAGVNEVSRTLNPQSLAAISGKKIDATRDPSAEFDASIPIRDTAHPTLIIPGSDLSKAYAGAIFRTTVTGRDTTYNTESTIDVGVAYAPSPADTQQGAL
jgi:hypothetical protein